MLARDLVRPIDILLVEDNPGDIRLTQEALRESKLKNRLTTVMDGQEALDLLHGKGRFKDAMRPDLILLDLNLPGMDGRTVLKRIKEHSDLRRIPVVVVTSSAEEQDILKSYNLHANCYITKPVDLDQFIAVVKSIENFWLTIVKLPTE